MKLLALNLVFNSLKFGFLHSRNSSYGDGKHRYPLKTLAIGRSNGSWCTKPITPSSDCWCNAI